MELVEAGELGLDDPVREHVPEVEPFITVRQLLDHTIGLPTLEHTDQFDPGRRPRDVATGDVRRPTCHDSTSGHLASPGCCTRCWSWRSC